MIDAPESMWRKRCLGDVKERAEVGGEREIPLFIRDLLESFRGSLERGVRDEDVDAVELLYGRVDDFAAVRPARTGRLLTMTARVPPAPTQSGGIRR